MRSERLYEKDHPRRLDSLDSAYDSIRNTTEILGGLEIRVERGGLVAPRIGDGHLPDVRGEMQALATDLHRAGIYALDFSKKFHVGELDTLARLVKASLLRSEEPANGGDNACGRRDFWRTAWKAFPLIRRRSAGWTRCWQVSSPRS